jgi:hypothetical protein
VKIVSPKFPETHQFQSLKSTAPLASGWVLNSPWACSPNAIVLLNPSVIEEIFAGWIEPCGGLGVPYQVKGLSGGKPIK